MPAKPHLAAPAATAPASKKSAEAADGKKGKKFKVTEVEGDLFEVAPDGAVLIHACNCLGSWGAGIAKAFREKYPAAYEIYHDNCTNISPNGPIYSPSDLAGTVLLIAPQPADYKVNPAAAIKHSDPATDGRTRPSKRLKISPAERSSGAAARPKKQHCIACLFTSVGYGRGSKTKPAKDKPDVILKNTRSALEGLRSALEVTMSREYDEVVAVGGAAVAEGEEGEDGLALQLEDKKKTEKEAAAEGKGKEYQETRKPRELWSCKFNSGLFGVDWADTRKVIEEVFKDSGMEMMVVSPPGKR